MPPNDEKHINRFVTTSMIFLLITLIYFRFVTQTELNLFFVILRVAEFKKFLQLRHFVLQTFNLRSTYYLSN